MKPTIRTVQAREVLDCRGLPTIEVEISLSSGIHVRAIAPAGTSRGLHETAELRDKDPEWYGGKGVSRAIRKVTEEIQPLLVGRAPILQEEIDELLCALGGIPRKEKLGGNAIVATSLAVAKAGAAALGIPVYEHLSDNSAYSLPLPWMLVLSGGEHARGSLDFQEYLVAPVCATSLRNAFHISWQIFQSTQRILTSSGCISRTFNGGPGLAPALQSNEEGIQIVVQAIEQAGYIPGMDVLIYLDVAATHFRADGGYALACEERALSSDEMVEYLVALASRYPIAAIEDGLSEDDWDGWVTLTQQIGNDVELVGDDLFTTNPERLRLGIEQGAANAVLVKVSQIGTISEARLTSQAAHEAGYRTVISARSGESEDPILAHLAVALPIDEGKIAAVVGAESTSRQNELLRIEDSLKEEGRYEWRK